MAWCEAELIGSHQFCAGSKKQWRNFSYILYSLYFSVHLLYICTTDAFNKDDHSELSIRNSYGNIPTSATWIAADMRPESLSQTLLPTITYKSARVNNLSSKISQANDMTKLSIWDDIRLDLISNFGPLFEGVCIRLRFG